jgi:hypothetical protein
MFLGRSWRCDVPANVRSVRIVLETTNDRYLEGRIAECGCDGLRIVEGLRKQRKDWQRNTSHTCVTVSDDGSEENGRSEGHGRSWLVGDEDKLPGSAECS